jgi:hypothetical protein
MQSSDSLRPMVDSLFKRRLILSSQMVLSKLYLSSISLLERSCCQLDGSRFTWKSEADGSTRHQCGTWRSPAPYPALFTSEKKIGPYVLMRGQLRPPEAAGRRVSMRGCVSDIRQSRNPALVLRLHLFDTPTHEDHRTWVGIFIFTLNSAQIETFLSSRATIVVEPNFDYLILK